MKGIAGFYYVDVEESGIYECKAKGIFRKEGQKPLVGDLVEIEILDEAEKTGNMTRILPRKNELIRGGDRQELHERIRELSMEAGRRVKEEGADNQLMALIAQDEMFHLDEAALEASLEPSKYVGCSAHQVERFLNDVIRPVLKENEADLGMKAEINV